MFYYTIKILILTLLSLHSQKMQFTLDDVQKISTVRNSITIYLEGGRSQYIKDSIECEDDYEWNDAHWCYIDKFTVSMLTTNSYVVTDWCGDSGHTVGDYGMTAEMVVILINKMCKGVPIEKISTL